MAAEHSLAKRAAGRSLSELGLLSRAYRLRQRARLMFLGRRTETGSDGLPLPPARLRYLTLNTTDPQAFMAGGQATAITLLRSLEQSGVDFDQPQALLDHGCGCGRILRQLVPLSEQGLELHGSDVNAELVGWCEASLPLASAVACAARPPLPHADASFDIVLAISVLTHLTADNGAAWIAELRRVLRPGGTLALTLHGDHSAEHLLRGDDLDRYRSGELVVRHESLETSNGCFAVHPPAYVRDSLLEGFELARFYPHAEVPFLGEQDLYVARRVSESAGRAD